jgi:hypothetical protein
MPPGDPQGHTAGRGYLLRRLWSLHPPQIKAGTPRLIAVIIELERPPVSDQWLGPEAILVEEGERLWRL